MALWPGDGPIWVMGCGNMGGALLSRWLACGMVADRLTVIDPAPAQIEGIRWGATPPQGTPALLILGVKPQMLDVAAAALAAQIGPKTVIVSILAGVECASLRTRFPAAGAIVRAMPNLPARLGKGVTGLFATDGRKHDAVDALFAAAGHVEWLASESDFHAITALSGSGPAFVYRFIGALADGGAELGLPQDQALRLARAMVEGAAALSITTNLDPVELARQVTSPNGTTAAGLAVLDEENHFAAKVRDTLEAAAQRSKELADAAKSG